MFKLFNIAPNRTQLVQNNYFTISTDGDAFVHSFYEHLFSLYPQTESFFANVDRAALEVKLLRALTLIVENLRRPEALTPLLEGLGKRHRLNHRVMAPHYQMFSHSLLKTLSDFSGDQWTSNLETAWSEAIDGVIEIMIYQV
jgi:nitric oxide dioxygenase